MENEFTARDQTVVDAFRARLADPTNAWIDPESGNCCVRGMIDDKTVTLKFSDGFVENFVVDLERNQAAVVVSVLKLALASSQRTILVDSSESQDVFPDGRLGQHRIAVWVGERNDTQRLLFSTS